MTQTNMKFEKDGFDIEVVIWGDDRHNVKVSVRKLNQRPVASWHFTHGDDQFGWSWGDNVAEYKGTFRSRGWKVFGTRETWPVETAQVARLIQDGMWYAEEGHREKLAADEASRQYAEHLKGLFARNVVPFKDEGTPDAEEAATEEH